jgi:lipopolysaccharide biosynthesis regulator YciM
MASFCGLTTKSIPIGNSARLSRNASRMRRFQAFRTTALPTLRMGQLIELGDTEVADGKALGALLTRISDSGGRYQCDDCGLHSVGWYWRCPKCRSWDTLRPAVFKWAEQRGGN